MFMRDPFLASDSADDRATRNAWPAENDASARRLFAPDCDLAPGERAASLLQTIESEIIPRLMLAHARPSNDEQPVAAGGQVGPEQVLELTGLALGRDSAACAAYVQARLAEGLALESMYLDLLAPTAQRLGALWEADLCDFTQVTVGLWRLQQVVYEHSHAFQRGRSWAAPVRRALLAPAPGSQHTFGIVIVGEFFRRAGWEVWGDPCASADEMAAVLHGEWFDLLGLSVGSECHVDAVASAILALRKSSLNPTVLVMVGGPVVPLRSDFVSLVGADASAPDAATAVDRAERLLAERATAP